MKLHAKLSSILLLFFLTACFEEAEFPDTPNIEFENLTFIDSSTSVDSLKLTFNFEDGGANLGILEDEDIFFPFNQYLVFLDENDSIITRSRVDEVEGPIYLAQLITKTISLFASGGQIFYSLEGTNHAVLAFEKEEFTGEISAADFTCPSIFNQDLNGLRVYGSSSEIGLEVYSFTVNGTVTQLTSREFDIDDDILVVPVDTHYNIFITIEQENISGEFEEVDFRGIFQSEDCLLGNFNGRIPWFSQDGESGKITYSIISRGLSIAFQENLLRIRFSVVDRLGNLSNEVITPSFRISEISQ